MGEASLLVARLKDGESDARVDKLLSFSEAGHGHLGNHLEPHAKPLQEATTVSGRLRVLTV